MNPDPKKRTDPPRGVLTSTEIVGFERDVTLRGKKELMVTFNFAAFVQRAALGLLPQKEFRIGAN